MEKKEKKMVIKVESTATHTDADEWIEELQDDVTQERVNEEEEEKKKNVVVEMEFTVMQTDTDDSGTDKDNESGSEGVGVHRNALQSTARRKQERQLLWYL